MKKVFLFIYFLIFSFSSHAYTKVEVYYIKTLDNKIIKASFKRNKDHYLVSKKCFKKKGCDALKILNSKKKFEIKKEFHKNGYIKSPFSLICSKFRGKNLILEDKKLNEYDFCMFSDKSMILSHDLYMANKFHN